VGINPISDQAEEGRGLSGPGDHRQARYSPGGRAGWAASENARTPVDRLTAGASGIRTVGPSCEYKGFNTLLAELEAFAAAVRGEQAYPIPPEDILHGVAVFEAIVRSAERHQPVTVART
jgi:predicted dehydrogenase